MLLHFALFFDLFLRAELVNDLLCCIYFCRKSAELLHDGRNVIQLRGKAVLSLSQSLCPPLSLSLHRCSALGQEAPHASTYKQCLRSSLAFFSSETGNGFAHISKHS